MPVISWSGWATLFFQVMPIFFVVGGFANATSWTAHHERGESWAGWVRDRALRLLWPTAAFVAVMTVAAGMARIADMSPSRWRRPAGWWPSSSGSSPSTWSSSR
jgi:fucose 4-O-acetylase-like acetyltransferase